MATLTINILNPTIYPLMTVYIEGYTLYYFSLADSSDTPLNQSYAGNKTLSFTVSCNNANQTAAIVLFVDLSSEIQYIQNLTSPSYHFSTDSLITTKQLIHLRASLIVVIILLFRAMSPYELRGTAMSIVRFNKHEGT